MKKLSEIKPSEVGLRPKGKRGRPSKEEQAARIVLAKKTDETPEQRVIRIAERFTVMYKLTTGVINQAVRSLIVSGAPGMGKSHTIEHLLQQAHDKGKIKYQPIRGALSAVNLYKQMFHFSGKDQVLLLDDADSIYEDEDAMNILKAGLDTSEVRKISWLSESAALKSEDIPTQFIYEGAIIFITNKDFQSVVDYERNRLAPHMAALMDRSIYLDLKLHDLEDCLAWVNHMVLKQHIMVQRGCTHEQEKEAVKWLTENFSRVRSLSIRAMLKVADYMVADYGEWESFAKVTLLR